jgi:hypothetical protein
LTDWYMAATYCNWLSGLPPEIWSTSCESPI